MVTASLYTYIKVVLLLKHWNFRQQESCLVWNMPVNRIYLINEIFKNSSTSVAIVVEAQRSLPIIGTQRTASVTQKITE